MGFFMFVIGAHVYIDIKVNELTIQVVSVYTPPWETWRQALLSCPEGLLTVLMAVMKVRASSSASF